MLTRNRIVLERVTLYTIIPQSLRAAPPRARRAVPQGTPPPTPLRGGYPQRRLGTPPWASGAAGGATGPRREGLM